MATTKALPLCLVLAILLLTLNVITQKTIDDNEQLVQKPSVAESSLFNRNEIGSVEVLETPDKSESDKKSYRVIRLQNDLKVILVSDPKRNSTLPEKTNDAQHEKREKLAACSLCVDVGSFSDPRDVQGLAHFLEHMIFMGSEKYPSENDFGQFLQKSGGSDNADTDFDETSFYFETHEEFLDEGLDRFSQLFKAPLMLKEAMTREREAVESEFVSKSIHECVRRGQLLSSIGQASHPSSLFAWGNLKTLKENITDDALHKRVHDFQKRHYSAHRMYVCIQSNLPLDDLQEIANRHFSGIPNNGLPGDDFSKYTDGNAFQSKFFEKVYFVKPIESISKIDITWCLQSMIKDFEYKPDEYLSHLLGHEGKGSLLSYLRKKLWAVDLMAGTEISGMGSNKLFSLFNVGVYLTEDGFDHLDEILGAIFSYLKLLQLAGPKESIFRETQTTAANDFRFSNERDAIDNARDLALNLKMYPTKYILNAERLHFKYNPKLIQQITDKLNSRKFNIMITSTRQYENIKYDLTEPWFGTKYSEIDMPEKWISLWKNAKPSPEFSLPEPNPFIADDFTILYKDGLSTVSKYPTKILDNEVCELWYRQDDKFLQPTACYHFYFMTPLATASTENMFKLTLLATLLKHQFVEELYPATIAGLNYKCSASDLGLVFKVKGFNQKLHLLVDVFSKALKSLADNITEEKFNVFVHQQFKHYENIFLQPKSLTKELRLNVIEAHHQPLYQKNQLLRSLNFTDFQQFCREYCEQMKIKALMQGNISKDRALSIMNNVLNELHCGNVSDLSSMELRSTRLPIGANYLRCKTFDAKDTNTVISNFYQIGPISYRTQNLIDLLAEVAFEPMFNQLRTKEQLAYDVSFNLRENYGILGYSITLNSQESKFSVDHVDDRIENFRQELATIIENMKDDDFENIKTTLAKLKRKEDNELSEEVQRNWDEIKTNEYEFDRTMKELKDLSTITKSQLLEFYKANLGETERKLSIQVIGNVKEKEINGTNDVETELEMNEDLETRRKRFDALTYVDFNGKPKGNLIHDLMEFKRSQEVYPVTKINVFGFEL